MRVLLSAMTLAMLAAVAVPAQAQTERLAPTLAIDQPYQAGETSDGIPFGGTGTMEVGWTLTFEDAASATEELATNRGSIRWTLECPEPITMEPTAFPLAYTAGVASYEGKATLSVQADPAAVGGKPIACQITGNFTGTSTEVHDTVQAPLVVVYKGGITVNTIVTEKTGGPQKQIPYPMDITNTGNARTLVTFTMPERPGGRWNVLLPENLLLEPGQTTTAVLVVSTPFKNGYVRGSTDIHLVIGTAHADDPELMGPSTPIDLGAKVKGTYIPGPTLPLLVVALAVVAVRARR
ncbi:MAG: hypothetical protein AABY18_09840 [Candidatus Thermoplasmatota archaeon]